MLGSRSRKYRLAPPSTEAMGLLSNKRMSREDILPGEKDPGSIQSLFESHYRSGNYDPLTSQVELPHLPFQSSLYPWPGS